MTSPRDPAAQTRAEPDVHLTIDEATVVLGLLDLLQPPVPSPEPALLALVERTRTRLAAAISTAISELPDEGGIRLA